MTGIGPEDVTWEYRDDVPNYPGTDTPGIIVGAKNAHLTEWEPDVERFELTPYVSNFSIAVLKEIKMEWTTLGVIMGAVWDEWANPWKVPHRNPFPEFVLCPRVERARLRYVAERRRLNDLRYVWTNGLPGCVDDH